MTSSKSTKRALVSSALAILMCVAMLIGTTFAWFTDTASTAVNKIQAGNLEIELQMKDNDGNWVNAEGKTLPFLVEGKIPAEGTQILWEPGCTYYVPQIRVLNKGNLAVKFEYVPQALGVTGKLAEVLEFVAKNPVDENGDDINIEPEVLKPGDYSPAWSFGYHMDENAGNEYQNATASGMCVTVVATQATYEKDSKDDQYDKDAEYPITVEELKATYAADATNTPDGFVVTEYRNNEFDSNSGKTGTITIKDAESLLYFAYVLDPAAAYAKVPDDGWQHTSIWYSGAYARHIVLDADIDLQGITLPNGFGNMKDFDFDGQGHTIKNATINYTGTDNTGLFVGGNRGISNLVVENIKVVAPNGTENAAGIVSSDANAAINSVTVRNSSVTGGKYTGAIVGYNYGSVTNCVVENCTVSGRYKVGGIVGYICQDAAHPISVTGNKLTDVTVKAENVLTGKTAVIGKIVGNWNATVGTCNNNTFSGTTVATDNIGKTESGCTVTE